MRPYLILTAVVLMTVAAFGQQPVPRPYGACFYGCGPFIPMVTTPEVSLQQFSPNPVGASNATTGLIAGATNSTLSQIDGSTSSVYTVAVWYQGGAPLMTPDVRLWPELIGREGRPMHAAMHETMYEERARGEGALGGQWRDGRLPRDGSREDRSREERGQRQSEEVRGEWTYIGGPSNAATGETGFKKAAHSYNNGDVTRQNDKNGAVKYDGKTEKI
jgi:hypothetical protein